MQFSNPVDNVLQFGIKPGQKVGDLGTGAGHYALAAAGIVGEDGMVYAVDVQEDVLKHLADSAERKNFSTIETVWGNIEKVGGTKLRDGILDAVILSNTLFQLENRDSALAEIKRILKPGGKLMVIDWAGAYNGIGPDQERVVSEHEAEELFIMGGFHKVKSFRAGPHHYSIVFTRPNV